MEHLFSGESGSLLDHQVAAQLHFPALDNKLNLNGNIYYTQI